jgi:hypothetical protein
MDRVSPHRSATSTNGSQLQGDDAITASQGWAHATFSAARGAIEIRLETHARFCVFCICEPGCARSELVRSLGPVLCTPRLGGRGRRFRSITPLE